MNNDRLSNHMGGLFTSHDRRGLGRIVGVVGVSKNNMRVVGSGNNL